MKKILVACDLDNTLIHSYKYRREDDICVEIFKGREQGFICKDAVKKLVLLNDKVEFIPITTRSIEQYQRIQWEKMVVPEYALTTNGAILLKNGVKDDVWLQESTRIVRKYQGELNRVLEFLEKEEEYIRCKFVDGMYVFLYCKDGVDIAKKVERYRERTILHVVSSGRKIYFLPPEFNKGEALCRLKERFLPNYVVAAGDSEMDLPMMESADFAFGKREILGKNLRENRRIFIDENNLLNEMFDIVESIEEGSLDEDEIQNFI